MKGVMRDAENRLTFIGYQSWFGTTVVKGYVVFFGNMDSGGYLKQPGAFADSLTE